MFIWNTRSQEPSLGDRDLETSKQKRQSWNSNCEKSCLGLKKTTINQIMVMLKKVWSGVCQDKVQMCLPSPCTGRMLSCSHREL